MEEKHDIINLAVSFSSFSFCPNLKRNVISVVPKEICDFDWGVVDIMSIAFYMVDEPNFLY